MKDYKICKLYESMFLKGKWTIIISQANTYEKYFFFRAWSGIYFKTSNVEVYEHNPVHLMLKICSKVIFFCTIFFESRSEKKKKLLFQNWPQLFGNYSTK